MTDPTEIPHERTEHTTANGVLVVREFFSRPSGPGGPPIFVIRTKRGDGPPFCDAFTGSSYHALVHALRKHDEYYRSLGDGFTEPPRRVAPLPPAFGRGIPRGRTSPAR